MTRQISAFVALLAGTLVGLPLASASVVTSSFDAGTPVQIDAATNVTVGTVDFTAGQFGSGEEIGDIVVQIDWLHTDGSCTNPSTSGGAFQNETGFRIVSPTGTAVDLVTPNSNYYSGGTSTPWVTTSFTSMVTNPSPQTPADGTYAPQNPTTAFAGESPVGTWTLQGSDSAGADPLCVQAFEVTVLGAESEITTQFTGGNGQSGNMFDINAINTITVTAFDLHIDSTTSETVIVYTRSGSYVPGRQTSSGWTQVATGTVTGQGSGNPTPFSLGAGAFTVAAGTTTGVYITLSTGTNIDYSNGTMNFSNGDLTLTGGHGVSYPFQGVFSPRIWNGTIYYNGGAGGSGPGTGSAPFANGANGAPYQGDALTNIEMDGSLSTDTDGSIVQYEWACEGVENGWSPAPAGVVNCVYPAAGTYQAVLRVTDDLGLIGVERHQVVANIPGAAPSADAGGPYTANQGAPVGLDGSGTVDPDNNITEYQWDCTDDGTYDRVGNSSPVGDVCTYADIGTYTVRLLVIDADGFTDTDTAQVTIVNTEPVGVSGGPYAGDENVAVTVDGSGSGDVDGVIVQWEWDCMDDGTFEISSSSSTATCTYPDNGVFALALRVTDDDGGTNVVATTVAIDNVAPAITGVSYPSNALEGAAASLSATATDTPADTISYAWNFGDGTTGAGASVSHTWPTSDDYIVTLTVTDEDGGVTTTSSTVTVGNVAPTIDSVSIPSTGVEAGTLSFSSTASDDGGDALVYTWDWGDGSTTDGAVVQHAYADQGTYTVTLTVTDDDGGSASTSSTVAISNVNPQITSAVIPSSGDEAETLFFSATGTDVAADTLTFSWDFGDGGTATGTNVTHVYDDNATYTVTLTLTDEDGGSATTSANIAIANVAPQIANVAIPGTGDEGQPVAMSADAVDAAGEVLTWVWDYGDGNSDTFVLAQGASASSTTHAYDDEGTYNIVITVTDDDGGIDIFNTSIITISNLDPVVSSYTVPDGDEGDTLQFDVVASDAPGDPITIQWDFGDGNTATGASPTHTYTDNGNFTVTITIQDDGEGGETIVTDTANILNVAPTLTSVTAPGTGGEGEALLFEVVSDDVGIDDLPDHIAVWNWGDGTTDTGMSLTHAYADQGTWTVTLTVDDGDTGQVSQTMTVVTDNVAPTITSTPPTNAVQGTLYSYQVIVNEPGDDVLTFSLAPSAPAGMTIDTATGLIEFTATYAQSLAGPYTVVIGVDDGEGGVDGQVYTLNVLSADTDGDGIADDWETANGLDPNDPSDGNVDYDLDGLTNVEEFGLDQDPHTYDGPSAPTAVFPVGGEEIDTDRPDLLVDNAIDPNGDALLYDFQVFSDVAMANLVTSFTDLVEGTGQTTWKVDISLAENTDYWWRARAADPYIAGAWSAAESMFINTENEEPDDTTLVWPIGGEVSGSLTPALEWNVVEDIDRDVVSYDVEVLDGDENVVAFAEGVPATVGDLTATWTVDVTLTEDTVYSWRVLPVDEHGLEGNWTDLETFFADATNELPQGVSWVAPADGSTMADQSPQLIATEGWDPEGTELTYRFEVDTVDTFDSADFVTADLPGTGEGTVTWDLAEDGVTLPANSTTYARVRGVDADGLASAPETISFFVRGANDAPNIPVLVSPEDAAESDDTTPELVVETPTDPEGDTVFVEFILAADIDLTDIIGGVESVLATGDTTSWVVDPPMHGRFYWSARSFDEDGAASDWAEPWLYVAPDEPVVDPGDDDDSTVGGPACDCASSLSGREAPGLALLLLVLPLLAVRRRR